MASYRGRQLTYRHGLVFLAVIAAAVYLGKIIGEGGCSTVSLEGEGTGRIVVPRNLDPPASVVKVAPPAPMAEHPVDDARTFVTRLGGNPATKFYGYWPVYNDAAFLPHGLRVYSFGIGGDVTFDRAVAKMRNATVACFDPTIDLNRFAQIGGTGDSRLKFFQIGLGPVDGEINFYKPTNPTLGSMVSTPGLSGFYKDASITAPVRRVASILRDLGDKHVDFLKVDCEGCEFTVFTEEGIGDLLNNRLASPLQIAIEFHDRFSADGTARRNAVVEYLKSQNYRHVFSEAARGEENLFVRPRP